MKVITKNTDYAIRVLMRLAAPTASATFINVKTLSQEEKIPYPFLRRIMHTLFKNKYVDAQEGRKGGYRLKRNPSHIKVLDIIKLFQGDVVLSECMLRKKICSNRATCVLRKEILNIEKIVNREFARVTIQGLLNKSNHKKRS